MENKGFKINEISLSFKNIEYFNIAPDWLPRLSSLGRFSEKEIEHAKSKRESSAINIFSVDPSGRNSDSVAIIDIRGALYYSGIPEWAEMFGVTSYELFLSRFNSAMADSSIKTIILRIQSPGGTAFGGSEVSQRVFEARSQKKIVAFADPYAFSAAYQIGSAASEFYTIKSGMVGSIGSYSMHTDYSQYLKNEGINVTFISAGEKKVDGNEYEPLSARGKKDIQDEVNRFYEVFVSDVARNRGVDEAFVKENFGKGGSVMAEEAVQAGMIDGIATIDGLISSELSLLSNNKSIVQSRAAFIKNNLAILDLED